MKEINNLVQWDEYRDCAYPEKLPKGVRITFDVIQIGLCIWSFINPLAGVVGFIHALWCLMLTVLTEQSNCDILLHIIGMALTLVGLHSLATSFASLILSEVQWLMDVEDEDS